jgi:lysophospholipid acyltransferase (LPLAT)-like uncharacterized protein
MIFKSIIHSCFIQTLIATIIFYYIKLVRITSKTTYINIENLNQAKKTHKNIIFAFWHGRELMLPSYLANQGKMFSIISLHKDGDLVAKLLAKFGSKIIRGSSNQGGTQVIRHILKEFKQDNTYFCITPDGPTGPRMKVSGAIIGIAKISGAIIVPVTFSSKKVKILNSWDAFMVPSLFNDLTISFGEKILIPKKASEQEIKQQTLILENSLNNMSWDLDKSYGRGKIKTGIIKKRHDFNI